MVLQSWNAGVPTLPWLFVVNVCLDSPQNKGGAATYNKGKGEQTFNICLRLHGVLLLGPAYFLLCLGRRSRGGAGGGGWMIY